MGRIAGNLLAGLSVFILTTGVIAPDAPLSFHPLPPSLSGNPLEPLPRPYPAERVPIRMWEDGLMRPDVGTSEPSSSPAWQPASPGTCWKSSSTRTSDVGARDAETSDALILRGRGAGDKSAGSRAEDPRLDSR